MEGCVFKDRKTDCLGAYDHLRAIGNSPEGFAGVGPEVMAEWSPAEAAFYRRMVPE